MKVIVMGDAMLDRYWHGDTSRISPEAPVPVVHIEAQEERVGGAANVAVNVQALGIVTTFIGVVGEDEAGETLQKLLGKTGVQCALIKALVQTTLKLRVLGRHQQLIRLDFERKTPWPAEKMVTQLASVAEKVDVLILSDYAKGVLAYPQDIIAYARERGMKIVVDPKHADLNIYRGAHVLTPNLGEFEAMVGSCKTDKEIEIKGLTLVKALGLEGLLVTRGSKGMSLIESDQCVTHIPAKAKEVFDVTGAGDTVIAVLAASLAEKKTLLEAAQLANVAAGISVGRLGTATVTKAELQAALLAKENHSVETLLVEIQRRKAKGEKIVMTNGCFDILHAGHVTYLKQARALGDCLIVAVNSDASVSRLKGPSRPINPLAHRMDILSALACVDYVIDFDEPTPQKLIAALLPTILVKGGDYKVEQIAGAKEVIQEGGEVKILPFVPGCSTTTILDRLLVSQTQEETT